MNPLPPSAHRESDVRPPTQHSDAPREQEEAWEEACRSDSEAALGEAAQLPKGPAVFLGPGLVLPQLAPWERGRAPGGLRGGLWVTQPGRGGT